MEQEMPDYETIRAAVAGEKWALEKVLDCYSDEINRLAMVKKRQPDGSVKEVIDEDLRQTLIMKLLEAIPQFPIEKE
ncbi:TPA: helix-turn-helix domain-containing protein [Clostridioides difficile]|nr:helix-turn-helix domain-containing protein [Clostridioides difficile]HBY2993667.1 helix-turn-helix domain-containing protein [Clostridioides difficile]